uniref:Uncharacterized protein n=1 Tax=Anguilla anguilla TaxID=7936 RepID=A0A0E9UMK3_ANGAN
MLVFSSVHDFSLNSYALLFIPLLWSSSLKIKAQPGS